MVHAQKGKYFSLQEKMDVVKRIQSGESIESLAKKLNRSPITLSCWERAYRLRGKLSSRDTYVKTDKKKYLRKRHGEEIREYLKEHPKASYSKLSKMLNNEVGVGAVRYYCVKNDLRKPTTRENSSLHFSDMFKLSVIFMLKERQDTIENIAKEINRSPITIKCWERWFRRKGCFRASDYTDSLKGKRRLTKEDIDTIVKCKKENPRVSCGALSDI